MGQQFHIEIRRRSLIDLHAALAVQQGFPHPEARLRAVAQDDLDIALTSRQLTIREGLRAAGWTDSDWGRIASGDMPTIELTALVGYVRALPTEPHYAPVEF